MNKLDQAKEYQNEGKFEEVDALFEEIIQEEPENVEVMFMLAKSKMNQNSLDDALSAIEKALSINDEEPEYNQIKGSIFARMGLFEDAIKALKKALIGNPNDYQSQIIIGHLYYSKGSKKNAEKHFNMALKIDGSKVDAQVNLAKILLDDGEVEIAIKKLRAIEQQYPQDPTVKMMMGQAFIENGAYSFAENYFQKVLEIIPQYDLARLYLGIAKVYTGDSELAEKIIHGFNQQYQNIKEGMAAMGILFFKKGQYKAAYEFLKVAISEGISPLSWRGTFAEAQARMGLLKPAIDFYKKMTDKYSNKAYTFRLAELYEMKGKTNKAIKQYKKTDKTESKYILSLLGLARCYLLEEKAEDAEKVSNEILAINDKSPEATLILINSLLFQDKQQQALKILDTLNYESLNDVFKKTLRVLHAMILDKQQDYQAAMAVFTDNTKKEQVQIPQNKKLTEQDLKKIQSINTEINPTKNEPIFIIGTQSTDINNFLYWLIKQNIKVLNDRLLSEGRQDIFHSYQKIDTTLAVDEGAIRVERNLYHEKAQALMNTKEDILFADCIFTNPYQMAIIKKYFPKASVILLTRDSADVWLNQKAFGEEPIESKNWNEAINQILSMGLNITQVNIDNWLANDKKILAQLSEIFKTELQPKPEEPAEYWRKTFFPKGHWKNYKKFLV